jgi:hypothetical protein
MVRLGDADIEGLQAILQAARHHPLVLERLGVGDVQLNSQQSHNHLSNS